MRISRTTIVSISTVFFTLLSSLTLSIPASAAFSKIEAKQNNVVVAPAVFTFKVGTALTASTEIVITPDEGTPEMTITSGTLPSGLDLDDEGPTVKITGTPTAVSVASVIVITAVQGSGDSAITRTLTITINTIDLPSATAVAPTNVTGTTATLKSTVIAGGAATEVRFCWQKLTEPLNSCTPVLAPGVTISGNSITSADLDMTVLAENTSNRLLPGTAYHYRVEVRNSVSNDLENPWIRSGNVQEFTTASITAPTAPGTPTAVATAAGTVSLTWAAPSSDGGAPITRYDYRRSENTGSSWSDWINGTSARSVTISSLDESKSYVFQVRAVNSQGNSDPSPQSTPAIFPRVEPGTPTSVSGISSATESVALTWTAPSNGGSAITNYLIEYRSGSSETWTSVTKDPTTTASFTVTGLTNGSSYQFRVKAVNAVGEGSFSTPSTSVLVGVPSAPGRPTGTAGASQVTITWSEPTSTAGSAITDYKISYSSDSGVTWTAFNDGTSTSRSATVTGLTNGTGYVFRVAATNARGDGPWSQASTSITPTQANPTISGVTPNAGSTAGGTSITINGSNFSATNISVTFNNNPGTNIVVTGTTSITVTTPAGVAGDATIRVTVGTLSATNSNSTTQRFRYVTPPATPTGVTATAGINAATVNWTSVSGATSYSVTSTPAGCSLTGVTTTTANCTSLTAGTSYTFRVIAVNDGGSSSASNASSAVTPKAPTVTTTENLTITFSGTSTTVSAARVRAIRQIAATIRAEKGFDVKIAINGFTRESGATKAEQNRALARASSVRKVARSAGITGTYTVTATGKAKTVAKSQKVVMSITWTVQP